MRSFNSDSAFTLFSSSNVIFQHFQGLITRNRWGCEGMPGPAAVAVEPSAVEVEEPRRRRGVIFA